MVQADLVEARHVLASGPTLPPPTGTLAVFAAHASNTGTLHLRRILATPIRSIRTLPSLVRILNSIRDGGAACSRDAGCRGDAQEGRGGDRRADGLQYGEEPAGRAPVHR